MFHPYGVGFTATLEPRTSLGTGAQLFDRGQVRPALVRLSRAAGLPESLADPCGLAFRIPDAYGPDRPQDLLLISSGRGFPARYLILPARGFADRPYSSLLPYRVDGELVLFGAEPFSPPPGPGLADLAQRTRAEIAFRIKVATPSGPWREIAELTLGERLEDDAVEDLRLDPSNTGGGMELAGLFNRLRRPAYRGSQVGRGAPPHGGPEAPTHAGLAEVDPARASGVGLEERDRIP